MKRLFFFSLYLFLCCHGITQPVKPAKPLPPDTMQLKGVTVTASKPAISLKTDKKIFEAGKDLLSQTGSALELLNGVPAVSVSASGGISLRGNSNVLVLINGRRSGMTAENALEQVPASQVERVEVITNPSSQYDAAGSAGIINIIIKKNKKAGLNGQLRLVGGAPNETRVTPSLNYKSDKLNLFSTLGIRLSDYTGLYTTDQATYRNGTAAFLQQRQEEHRHDNARLLYFGADYLLNEQNTITAAFLKNATHDHDKTTLHYNYTSNIQAADSTLLRSGESWEKRNYNQLEFNYTRTFRQPGKKYTVDMQYDFWNSDKDWNLATQKLLPVTVTLPAIRTSSIGASKDLLIKTDLAQPLDSNTTFELGCKGEYRKVTSAFKAEAQQGNDWNIVEDIDNQVDYNELIGSAYTQLSSKIHQLSYQLGLRTELTRVSMEDKTGLYRNKSTYTRLFPALHLNYQFAGGTTLQGSYSKRINRPSLYLLYPFTELTDFNARFTGNPELNPSYATVFELGFLKRWHRLTFNPSLYYQHNSSIIQDYTYRNGNGIFITSPVNIDQEIRYGVEATALYQPLKWLHANMELNAYRFTQGGWYKEQDFDYTGSVFTSRISTQVKLPYTFSLQCRYNFTGAQSNAQSHTGTIHYIDFGCSKNLLHDKATVLLDAANLFNLRRYSTTTTGNDYRLTQVNNPNAARYRLTFIYRLNLTENQTIRQAKSSNRE
jgi:outer membrane receptor protein involved in Fe transport